MSVQKSPSFLSRGVSWYPVILALVVYANTFTHSYALDDYLVIVNNDLVQAGLSQLGELLSSPFTWGAGFNDGLYRPFTLFTFALEVEMFGSGQPMISHLINVLLYAALCGLLLQVCRSWFPRLSPLWLLVLVGLYTVHPLHTEVVANIKSRDEILGFLFILLSAYTSHRYFKSERKGMLVLSLLTFSLALFSKESTIVFLILLPFAYYFLVGAERRSVAWLGLGYLAVALLFLVLRHYVLQVWHPAIDYTQVYNELSNSLAPTSGMDRFGMAALLVAKYLFMSLFPLHLGYEYSFNQIPLRAISNLWVLFSIATNLSLIYLMLQGLMKKKSYGFALLFFYATIALYSNWLFIIGVTFAERFAFVPSFAICLLLVSVLQAVTQKYEGSKRWCLGLAGIIVLLFATRTVLRNPTWKDNTSLFIGDIENVSQSAKAQYNCATQYSDLARAATDPERGRLTQLAIQYFEQAIALYPDYPDAQNNLANIYLESKEFNKALLLFNQLLEKHPGHRKGYYNRAITHYNLGQYAQSITDLNHYLDTDRYNLANRTQANYFIGMAYGFVGQFDQSIHFLQQAVTQNANYWEAQLALGKAYGLQGQFAASIPHFEAVLRIVPQEVEGRLNLAISYMNLGEYPKVVNILEAFVQAQPQHGQAQSLLQDAKRKIAAGS